MEIHNVAHYRKQKNMTQDDLAAATKLSSSTIHRIERTSRGNKTTLTILAKALGVKPDQLKTGRGDNNEA